MISRVRLGALIGRIAYSLSRRIPYRPSYVRALEVSNAALGNEVRLRASVFALREREHEAALAALNLRRMEQLSEQYKRLIKESDALDQTRRQEIAELADANCQLDGANQHLHVEMLKLTKQLEAYRTPTKKKATKRRGSARAR